MSTLTQDPGPQSILGTGGVNMWAILKAITQNGTQSLTPLGAIQVINNSGADIATDKLVTFVAGDSVLGIPQIVLANAGTAGHVNIYVTRGTIQNGAQGLVYECSQSAANLNTNSFAAVGSQVYLSASSSGGFTQTAPTGITQRVVPVGLVLVKSATVGQILWICGPPSIYGNQDIQGGIVQQATGTISSANITGTAAGQLGNANGVVLVPAAPAKAINELISAVIAMDFATAAYTAGGNTTINISGGGSALTGLVNTTTFIQAASDIIIELVPLAATNNSYGTGANGLALVTSIAPTNPGTAAGVINWVVNYRQIPALLD